MQRIDDKQSLNQTLFDNIDRIIHASRIEEIQELKRLIRFIDHLIQASSTKSPTDYYQKRGSN